jgi:diaminopimelate decarboxylase
MYGATPPELMAEGTAGVPAPPAGDGRFPVTIPGADQRMPVPCMLTGPSCDSQDTILDHVWLPLPHVGDQVLIGNTGAYTTCYSGRSAFNGYPAPEVRIKARSQSSANDPVTISPAGS